MGRTWHKTGQISANSKAESVNADLLQDGQITDSAEQVFHGKSRQGLL